MSRRGSSPAPGGARKPAQLRDAYVRNFTDMRHERRFLSTVGFFGAFTTARVITHAIRAGRGPFRNITPGGHHIHHMTFGILGMIGAGTLWINDIGNGARDEQRRASQITSTVFGAGVALTLDEFALWLNLADDYWTKQGRESIDAVAVYGSLLMVVLYGRSLIADATRVLRGR